MAKRELIAAVLLLMVGSGPGAAQDAGSTTPPDARLLPEGDAFALYDRGFGSLRRGDWAGAEAAFSEILRRYPNDELATNARYWLAESYLQQGETKRAARAFHEVFLEAPDAARAPDALYKESVALARAGDAYNACLTLRKLKQLYPFDAQRYPADERC